MTTTTTATTLNLQKTFEGIKPSMLEVRGYYRRTDGVEEAGLQHMTFERDVEQGEEILLNGKLVATTRGELDIKASIKNSHPPYIQKIWTPLQYLTFGPFEGLTEAEAKKVFKHLKAASQGSMLLEKLTGLFSEKKPIPDFTPIFDE